MSDTALTDYTPIEFQYQELDVPYQEIDFKFEPVELDFKPMKVDWLEAKSLYLTDHKLSYRDIATKYGVSLKQVKKWGARQQWREGRQEVSKLAQTKITENLAESAAETNQRHAEQYQEAQELTLAYLEILDVQMTNAVVAAEREERIVEMKELPSTALLLSLTKSLVTAVNGERVCLGLPTKVTPAPVGWKPLPEEHPELEGMTLTEQLNYLANQEP
ncbi:MAG: phage terminase small subunit-related protein [Candidatus Saccharimonadales bacterium]